MSASASSARAAAAGIASRVGAARPGPILAEDVLIYTMYNFKGGVGKTSLSTTLGRTLVEEFDESVLMVDGDPQRHLSCMWLEDETAAEHDAKAAAHEEDPTQPKPDAVYNSNVDQMHLHHSSTALRLPHRVPAMPAAAFNDTSFNREFKPLTEVFHNSLYKLLEPTFNAISKIRVTDPSSFPDPVEVKLGGRQQAGKLFLIPGDLELLDFETQLAGAIDNAQLLMMGFFRHAVRELAVRKGCRVVLVDVGPHSGMLNFMISMSADALLIPSFADNHSCHSLRDLLFDVLPRWIKKQDDLVNKQLNLHPNVRQQFRSFLFNDVRPTLLPILVSAFNITWEPEIPVWRDIQDPLNFRAKEPIMGQHSTFFFENILASIVWGEEKDANGVRRRLLPFVNELMYAFGPKGKEQRHVALVPDMSELVLWSQETGHTPMGYLSAERGDLDRAATAAGGDLRNLSPDDLMSMKLFRLASYCAKQCDAFLRNMLSFHDIRVRAMKERAAAAAGGAGAGAGAGAGPAAVGPGGAAAAVAAPPAAAAAGHGGRRPLSGRGSDSSAAAAAGAGIGAGQSARASAEEPARKKARTSTSKK